MRDESGFTGSGAAGGTARSVMGAAPAPPAVEHSAARSANATTDVAFTQQPRTDPSAQLGSDGAVVPSMIIRTGNASIEVDSLEPAVAQVRQLAQRVGGYVANTSVQAGGEEARVATLELKIPADRFDRAVSGLGTIGKVESVNVSAQDVSEEFVDVTARVANARRLEERLISLLATRTGKLQDVLNVERELARVREEIERFDGRLRYLKSRVAFSTLSVTIHEPVPVVGQYRGASVIGEAVRHAWRNFISFVAALIASLGFAVPLGALLVGAWLLVRRLRRRPPPALPGEA